MSLVEDHIPVGRFQDLPYKCIAWPAYGDGIVLNVTRECLLGSEAGRQRAGQPVLGESNPLVSQPQEPFLGARSRRKQTPRCLPLSILGRVLSTDSGEFPPRSGDNWSAFRG